MEMAELKDIIKQLTKENNELKSLNNSLIRQIKERSNAAKGLYPKKQHTGYSIVSSTPKEYRFSNHGNYNIKWIYETIIQTPYDLSFNYDDVKELVLNDFTKEDSNEENLFNVLGFVYLYNDKTYPDAFNQNHLKELVEEYKKYYTDTGELKSFSEKELEEIEKEAREDLNNSCYNFSCRINGRDGFWEFSFNHIYPIKKVPENMMFRKIKNAKKSKEKKNKETRFI